MKKVLAIALAASFSVSAFADQIKPGSTEAAQRVVSDYLALIYVVPKEKINVGTVNLLEGGQFAAASAAFDGKYCSFKLQRHSSANEFGWVVQSQQCKDVK